MNDRRNLYRIASIFSDLSLKIYQTLLAPSIFVSSRLNFGKNIFEEDWDLLIILDTCRPDALRAVADEYEFIDNISEFWSVGGDSWEWLANTFDRRHIKKIQNTAYITSNPNSRTVLENRLEKNHENKNIIRKKVKRLKKYGHFNLVSVNELGQYKSLYEHGIDQGHGMYPSPRIVTDHGISADRNQDFDRIILHYMPPHWPFIAIIPEDKREMKDSNLNNKIEIKEEPRDHTFEAYLDNLRWGLDEVSRVLKNMDREKVVITADHGTSFSKHLPYHISGSLNPKVRKVPWVVTTANDSETYHPEIEMKKPQHSVDEILEALGYKI